MDNKQAISELKNMKEVREFVHSVRTDKEALADLERKIQALDKAIKSLEAWDKVKEEIEENNPDNYYSDKPIIITKKTVIDIINKHLG